MTQFIRIAVFALAASLAAASVQARPVNMARLSEACQATILKSGIDPATLERRDVKVADDGSCTLVQTEAEPAATEPEAVEPEVVAPETAAPEAVEPEAVEPEVVEPVVVLPEVMEPEVVATEVVEPEVVESEVVVPEVSEPEVTEPDAVMTQEVEPEAVVPDVVDVATGVSANAAVIGDAGAAAEIEDDPDAVSDAAVAVVTETVTAEETRSSDEEFSAPKKKPAASDDSERNRDIARILGALAAGVVIGSLLDDNSEVVGDTGDRLIVQRDGQYHVLKDENLLLRQPGSDLRTEAFTDGSTRTVVTRQDGIRVVTIRDGNGALVRRTRFLPDGREYVLFDETIYRNQSVAIANLPPSRGGGLYRDYGLAGNDELVAALRDETGLMSGRFWSLRQIRENEQLRAMMPRIDLDVITFDSGSSALAPDQALSLARLGKVMVQMIDDEPAELFLIEGHTDAVGSEIANLTLSDRRAETVALALTEYFGIPPESMVVQGYGEAFPKVPSPGDERANRRAAVRRITPLLGD